MIPKTRTRAAVLPPLALTLLWSPPAPASPLDPRAFASLGTLSAASGTVTIDTRALTITGAGATSFTGVSLAQGPGLPAIAVFDFDGITLGAGVTVTVTGERPLALLSRGDATVAATIDLSGRTFGAGPAGGAAGGAGGVGGTIGPKAGVAGSGTGGGLTSSFPGNGAGFGGAGGSVSPMNGGGVAYGNLLKQLEAGSGGSGGASSPRGTGTYLAGGQGGSGGGALELGAVGKLTVSRRLAADGGAGDASAAYPGGSGSGGGLLLHGALVQVTGSLSAQGGGITPPNAGSGGGGRIAVLGLGAHVLGTEPTLNASVNSKPYLVRPGFAGVLSLGVSPFVVPAGQGVALSGPVLHKAGQAGTSDPRIEILPQRDVTIQAGGSLTLAADGVLAEDATVQVQGSGLFDVAGRAQTVAALSGDGKLVLGGGALTLSGATDSVFSGALSGAGTLTRAGAGALTLSGASSFAGTVLVSGGKVLVNGALGAGAVTVSGGVLGGTGSVGAVNAQGGAVAPGAATPGVLKASTVVLGSTLAVRFNGTGAGSHDQLQVAGAVVLGGALQVDLGYTPGAGDRVTIVRNDGTGPVSGRFASVSLKGAGQVTVDYAGGDGNDVDLIGAAGGADLATGVDLGGGGAPDPDTMGGGCQAGAGGGMGGGAGLLLLGALLALRRAMRRR